jgi:hypothetical protein
VRGPDHGGSAFAGLALLLALLGVYSVMAYLVVVTRLLQQALFEVDPAEPVVYVVISLALLAVAELACWNGSRYSRAKAFDQLGAALNRLHRRLVVL